MKNNAVLREFIRYASANVLAMVGLSCYILADTFFIAQALGKHGLAALNLTIPVYGLIYGSSLMLGQGGATRYSLFREQDPSGEGRQAFSRALQLGGLCAVLLFLAGLLCSGQIALLLGADAATFEMCRCYIRVLLLFSPGFILNNIVQAFVRNDGAPRLSMAAMLTGCFANILLDYIFLFPLQMGMFGAILATCLSPLISLLVVSPFFLQRRNRFHLCRASLSLKITGRLCAPGLPALIGEMSSAIVMLLFNLILLEQAGNVAVAAYGVVANLSIVLIAIYNGIAQGTQPLFSLYCGRGQWQHLRQLLLYGTAAVLLVSLSLYLCVLLAADPIAALFNSEQDPLLQQIAISGMRIYFSGCLFAGINILLSTFFAAAAQSRPASLISLSRGFLLIIPLIFLLSRLWGLTGLWLVFPLTELLVCGLALLLYHRQKPERFSALL
ncbi:MAG: MATE family efflux transporter [Bacillota bacterium]|nr:MATE family efflux transporter [Bacillota bacterium]